MRYCRHVRIIHVLFSWHMLVALDDIQHSLSLSNVFMLLKGQRDIQYRSFDKTCNIMEIVYVNAKTSKEKPLATQDWKCCKCRICDASPESASILLSLDL